MSVSTYNHGQTPTDMLAPFAALAEMGEGILNAIPVASISYGNESQAFIKARRMAKDAKRDYDQAEAEFLAEQWLSDVTGADGKRLTVEAKKAYVDGQLAKAQKPGGALSTLYRRMCATEMDAKDAEQQLEAAGKTFRGTEAAADLVASMLRAAAR